MPALVAWVFRSGQRLVLVVVGLVAVLLVGGYLLSGRGPSGGSSATATTSTRSAAGLPDVGPATDVAVRFTTRWAARPAGQTKTQWLDALRPMVTQQLAAGLTYTDPETLPGGTPDGQPTVRYASTASTLVSVPLSSGAPVLVTVVQDGGQWRVSDIQPSVGD